MISEDKCKDKSSAETRWWIASMKPGLLTLICSWFLPMVTIDDSVIREHWGREGNRLMIIYGSITELLFNNIGEIIVSIFVLFQIILIFPFRRIFEILSFVSRILIILSLPRTKYLVLRVDFYSNLFSVKKLIASKTIFFDFFLLTIRIYLRFA